ncbi:MAG: HAMP domain-containing histidine kinase, partial [Clostridia bacterium]|nr:HAMP domain-containing histidine kinase [Clostridia bacterium]
IVKPLEESYEKQKRFISDAGHELKTPVSVVNANAELLEREIGQNQWLENIQYENERMGNLVTQLLDLARLENVETVKEEVNFSKVTAGEALPFESVAFEKGISLETEIEDNVLVEGNSAQLKQVVSILIDNALRHSKGAKVSVALKKTHGQAVLSVTNEGDEIPPEQRERIFERFYRADEARTGGENNYGLGLAIAKSVADSHGGTLSVECRDGLVEFIFKI